MNRAKCSGMNISVIRKSKAKLSCNSIISNGEVQEYLKYNAIFYNVFKKGCN